MDSATTRSQSRSRSRGREQLVSTGRGGVGNMRAPSANGGSREPRDPSAVDEFAERGRHATIASPPPIPHAIHSGRGGAGNVRSPSRDPADRARAAAEDAYEAQLVRERREREAGLPQSTGRGGVGNIARSRSRSRGPVPDGEDFHHHNSSLHSTGKGGLGNMYSVGESKEELAKLRALDEEDEAVRRSYERRHADDPVFSGKGGAGNFHVPNHATPSFVSDGMSSLSIDSDATTAAAERKILTQQNHGRTSGRGGAGNYIPPKEHSTERGRGGPESFGGPMEKIKNMVRSMSRSRERDD